MKKLMIVAAILATGAAAFAGPHGCGPCGPGWGHRPCGPGWGHRPPPPHHGGWWGRGGCNFWPGFVGGVVGGIACNAIARPYTETVVVQSTPTVVTQPVVVQQPVVVTQPVVAQPTVAAAPVTQVQNVWVEGRYVDTVQANGSVVRTWNPGHYEQRTVVVQ